MIMREKKQNKRGFTLTEVLVTVVIIAVLAAVCIPGAVAIRNRMKMTELDNSAKQLYLSAQNELMAIKAGGRLNMLESASGSRSVSSAPEDWNSDDGEKWNELYYLSSADTADTTVLSSYFKNAYAELDLIGGSFTIEFNPASGDVYGVFYSEDDITYQGVRALGMADRSLDTRKEHKIGYFGGSGIYSATGDRVKELPLEDSTRLVNAEELYLDLGFDINNSAANPGGLSVMIELADEHGKTCGFIIDGSDINNGIVYSKLNTNNSYQLAVLLDSIEYSFANITKTLDLQNPDGLTAGDDITVNAYVTYIDNSGNKYEGAAETVGNSLFAAKRTAIDDNDTAATDDDTATETVNIAYLRQLNNLRYADFDYADIDALELCQTQGIDFAADNKYWTENTRLAVDASIKKADNTVLAAENPMTAFSPIVNATLFKGNTAFDGKGNLLKNFLIAEGDSGTGIFSLFGSRSAAFKYAVSNVKIVNPGVYSTADYTGTIAGRVLGETAVDNCGVYIDDDKTHYIESYGKGTGGLFGAVDSNKSTISNSFAAVDIITTNNSNEGEAVGGLVGSVGGRISGCYTSGAIYGTNFVGGIAGEVTDSTSMTDCYTTSDIMASKYAGGIVGDMTGTLTAENLSFYGRITAGSDYGPMLGYGSANYKNCRYLKQSGYNDEFNITTSGLSAKSYSDCYISNSVENSHPYRAELKGTAFPFDMVTSDHYGNWPDKLQETEKGYYLCYYEKYEDDDSYGVYFIDADGQVISTLDTAVDPAQDKTISDGGADVSYGLLLPAGTSYTSDFETAMSVNGGNLENISSSKLATVSINEVSFDLYRYTSASISSITPGGYAQSVAVTDNVYNRTLYVNADYGAAISASQLATASVPLQVRTTDQLNNLAKNEKSGSGWYVSQTHNIEADKNTGNFDNNHGAYTFNGNKYRITGLSKNLYGLNAGTLINVRIYNSDIKSSSNIAALAITNQGTISGCKVYSTAVTATGSAAAAGLIYYISGGTVEHCGVFDGSEISSESGNAAGLICEANSAISSCGVYDSTVKSESAGASGFVMNTKGALTDCVVDGTEIVGNNYTDAYNGKAPGAVGMIGAAQHITVKNSFVTDCTITNTKGRAAGFVAFSYATISGCGVENSTISAYNHSAGFCVESYAPVSTSYVNKCKISSANGSYAYAAGFVYENGTNSSITSCRASGVTVSATGSGATAAGFVGTNNASVIQSYSTPVSVNAPTASGFVVASTNPGSSITDCYTVGRGDGVISATNTAAGFVASGNGSQYYGSTITNCYAAVALGGNGTKYGFGSNPVNVNCFWLYGTGFNDSLDAAASVGQRISFAKFAKLSLGNNWTKTTTAAQTHPLSSALSGQAYPYQRLSVQEHYGDWPDAVTTPYSSALGVIWVAKKNSRSERGAYGAIVDYENGSQMSNIEAGNASYQSYPEIYLVLSAADGGDWTISDTTNTYTVSASPSTPEQISLESSSAAMLQGYKLYKVSGFGNNWDNSILINGNMLTVSDGLNKYNFSYQNTGGSKYKFTFSSMS